MFTPAWLVEDMLDLVKDESERIDSRFLEPACGSGNFLVPVLRRKLATVQSKLRQERLREAPPRAARAHVHLRHRAACRQRRRVPREPARRSSLDYLGIGVGDEWFGAAQVVVDANIVQGDALDMTHVDRRADHVPRVGLPRQGQVPAPRLPLRHAHPASSFGRGHAVRRTRRARRSSSRRGPTRR